VCVCVCVCVCVVCVCVCVRACVSEAYNPFDIRVFQLADYLKCFLSFPERNSMISAAAVVVRITPSQHSNQQCLKSVIYAGLVLMCIHKPMP